MAPDVPSQAATLTELGNRVRSLKCGTPALRNQPTTTTSNVIPDSHETLCHFQNQIQMPDSTAARLWQRPGWVEALLYPTGRRQDDSRRRTSTITKIDLPAVADVQPRFALATTAHELVGGNLGTEKAKA